MSHSTPRVDNGRLHDHDTAIVLETPAWYSWLEDERNRSFHFFDGCGEFTARKERKQRGSWYWVAYRQVRGKLYKTYLGKSVCLTEGHLRTAARALNAQAGESGT